MKSILKTTMVSGAVLVMAFGCLAFPPKTSADPTTPAAPPAACPAPTDTSSTNTDLTQCTTTDTATNGNCGDATLQKCDLVSQYINPAIFLLSGLVGVAAVISLIVAGIRYSAAQGDPQQVTKAKAQISRTVIGLISYAFLFSLLQFLIPGGIF